ncbi:MAG TPA: 2-phospho-L-lactate transferase [Nitrososphaerales archaeon]|nr:2-phospho-L-lactate transferase [Nitrososphaerales archaeon]
MKVVALAGGTGSAKLLRGLKELPGELTVICNVGDNFSWQGLQVCPDIDIAMYALAGTGDSVRGWGVEGDSFQTLSELRRLGAEAWFQMGDRDLATSILRTAFIRKGMTLTEATGELGEMHGLTQKILPVTDDPIETHIVTPAGELHLQEFWVRDRGKGRVSSVAYQGAKKAEISVVVRKEILGADRVVICPANPVTSIGPMLAVGGVVEALRSTAARVSALSPMIARGPISGPAGKLMKATGIRPDSVGVARIYARFLDVLFIDNNDESLRIDVENEGPRCRVSDIVIHDRRDAVRLARELVAA